MTSSSLFVSKTCMISNLKHQTRTFRTKSSLKPFKTKAKSFSNGINNNDVQTKSFKLYTSVVSESSLLSPSPSSSSSLSNFVLDTAPQSSAASSEITVDEEYVEENGPMASLIGLLPEKIRPYAYLVRLDKPIGTLLLAWPCMWSLALAAEPGTLPDWKTMAYFLFVSFWTRNIGCTINDYFDKGFDSKVERTKQRPIASGAISGLEALIFLGIQLVIGYAFLLPVNKLSRLLWISSLPLVFIYPLMKRITYWPQAHLGVVINWGVLHSWAAVKGTLHPGIVFPLFLGCFFWTLEYDIIYAHQDKKDDAKVGVKSAALLLGDSAKFWISLFGMASVASVAISAIHANIGCPVCALLVPAAAQMGWQTWTVNLQSPTDCAKKFRSNMYYGAVVFFAILFGRLLL